MAKFIRDTYGVYQQQDQRGRTRVSDPTMIRDLNSGSVPFETESTAFFNPSPAVQAPDQSYQGLTSQPQAPQQMAGNIYDKINNSLLDLMRRKQALAGQTNQLQTSAINSATSPEYQQNRIGFLTPSQQTSAMQQESESYKPSQLSIAQQMELNNDAMKNTLGLLSTAQTALKPQEVSAGSTYVAYNPETGKMEPVYTAPAKEPSMSERFGTGEIGEWNFRQSLPPKERAEYDAYQVRQANLKGAASGGVRPKNISELSSRARAVYDNPAVIRNYTPTEKGKILDELSSAGVDISRFGLAEINSGQREQIALFDEIENEAKFISDLSAKTNLGPIASRDGSLAGIVGQASGNFVDIRSAINNMSSILLRMRSGAAVTPQEYTRIRGFIPELNEDEKTIQRKMSRFFSEIAAAKQNYIKRSTQSSFDIANSSQTGFSAPGVKDPLGIR